MGGGGPGGAGAGVCCRVVFDEVAERAFEPGELVEVGADIDVGGDAAGGG
ncbi:MAG: hypothetical protein ACR2IH_07795 [Pyrinomonadaceae bacterium]